MLLRLLLLIALAFFLAKPVSMQQASPEHWVVVVPGLNTSNLVLDKKAKWHWLAPGFPAFEEKINSTNIPISSLLRELDSALPANTKITVLLPEQLSGLDGERVRLSRNVVWKIIPAAVVSDNKNSVIPAQAGTQRLTPAKTTEAKSLDPRLRGDDENIHVAIRFDAAHKASTIYFRAAHTAWQSAPEANKKDLLDIADPSASIKSDRTALIWLAAGELPASVREWISKGGTAIVAKDTLVPEIKSSATAWRNNKGESLVRMTALGEGRILQWQQALTPNAMPELLDADFPEHLKTLLLPTAQAPERAFAKTQTPLTGAPHGTDAPQSLQIWLALLIALLFLLERWLANSPRRWAAA